MKFAYEHTDTFGGEANYCWAHRGSVEAEDKNVVRRVKKALGLTGVKCRKTDFGELVRLDIIGCCQCVFIWFSEEEV